MIDFTKNRAESMIFGLFLDWKTTAQTHPDLLSDTCIMHLTFLSVNANALKPFHSFIGAHGSPYAPAEDARGPTSVGSLFHT